MKSKTFRHGKWTYKTYCKNVGHGYEVGLIHKGKTLFVGNFIKSKEANDWYRKMNTEIPTFAKRYWATERTSVAFYTKFLANHIYNKYYSFVHKLVPTLNRSYNKKFNQDLRQYKRMKNNWYPQDKISLKKAA